MASTVVSSQRKAGQFVIHARNGAQPAKPGTRFLAALIAALLWATLLAHTPAHAQSPPEVEAQQLAGISPHLEAELASAPGPTSFLVILDEQADAQAVASSALGAAQTGEAARTQRAAALYHTLTATALRSQAPLRAWLDERGVPYRPFYIVNMIEVEGDAALAQALRNAPGVDRLAANPLVRGEEPVDSDVLPDWLSPVPQEELASSDMWPPGLDGLPFTHAPEVWDLGYTGQGIVVASQDTGVQWDHPALIDRYRGWDASTAVADHPYNWFDAWTTPDPADLCGPDHQVPCDDNSHGTHTVGTMVGDASDDAGSTYAQIGMAPGAQWIGCRNMRNNFGTPASYTACFEFMLAPYPQGGDPFTDGRPALAPHILNNSWHCPPAEGCDAQELRQVVETARAAGQLVVASAGNSGPSCETVQTPIALHDAAFTVGAHDSSGNIAIFSSRGPVTIDGSNRLKPDIAAPGVNVLSAIPPNGYSDKSGTSMSSPHVSGAAALLWSAAPDLIGDVDLTEQALIKSATPVLSNACMDGSPPPTSPNPTYGYGQLDALAAVTLARTPWLIVVKAVDEAGDAYPDLPVVLTDNLTRFQYRSRTGPDGFARLRPVLSGGYTLRVGSGDSEVIRPNVELPLAEDPDAGERRRSIVVTVQDAEPVPPNAMYLPLLEQ